MIAFVSAITFYNLMLISTNNKTVSEEACPLVMLSRDVKESVLNTNLQLRTILMRQDLYNRRHFDASAEKLRYNIHRLHEYTLEYPDKKQYVERLGQQVNEYLRISNRAIDYLQIGSITEAINTSIFSNSVFLQIERLSNEMIHLAEREMREAAANLSNTIDNTIRWVLIVFLLSVFFSIILAITLSRQITAPIRNMAERAEIIASGDLRPSGTIAAIASRKDEPGTLAAAFISMCESLRDFVSKGTGASLKVAGASEQLKANIYESSQAADMIAASAELTAGSVLDTENAVISANDIVKRVSGQLQEMVHNLGSLSLSKQNVMDAAVLGEKTIQAAAIKMEDIRSLAVAVKEAINKVAKSGDDIEKITLSIKKIADQTSLLSLNAQIEAASAGEHGKGFSVIAGEVGKLAEMADKFANEISDLVKGNAAIIQDANDLCERSVQGAMGGIEAVAASVSEFSKIMDQLNLINSGIEEMECRATSIASGNEEIVDIMSTVMSKSKNITEQVQNISAATQEQSATQQEALSVCENLLVLAEEMKSLSQRFKV